MQIKFLLCILYKAFLNNLNKYRTAKNRDLNFETVTKISEDLSNSLCWLISHKDYIKSQALKGQKRKIELTDTSKNLLLKKIEQSDYINNCQPQPIFLNQTETNKNSKCRFHLLDPKFLHSCLKVFTQRKMDELFSIKSVRTLFKYYSEQSQISTRIKQHKAMGKQFNKFKSTLQNMADMCS